MTSEQKAAYKDEKAQLSQEVSTGLENFIDSLPKVYAPKDIQVGSKVSMTYKERVKYLHNSEFGRLIGFKQDGSIQSPN